jgi:hypothetical protein
MLTLDLKRSKGNDRLTLVAAHPPKVGKGRAPRFVVGLEDKSKGAPPAGGVF